MNKNKQSQKTINFILFILGFAFTSVGQIDSSDSTAVVIAHWKMNEKQNYKVSTINNSVEGVKTISAETINYNLLITVVDSTQVGYILEWKRSGFVVDSKDEFENAIQKITENIPFLIITDEFGSSIQILNWEDIGIEIKSRAELLKVKYVDFPERLIEINRILRKSSTKDEMERNFILDVHQFFAFHGAKYRFNERIDLKLKVANNYGGDPLDANSSMIMDQMNIRQGTFIIRSSQRINPQQLTAVTYDYLASLNMIDAELPPYEEFPRVTKLIWGGSEIHGNSGWVIYSVETRQTTTDNVVTVEERTIELVRDTNK